MKQLNESEKKILEESYQTEKNSQVKIRILAWLYLYIEGCTMEQTTTLLWISIGSVQADKQKYEPGKLEKLRIISGSSGRPLHLTETQKNEIKPSVESGHYLTSEAVCELVDTRDGLSDTPNAMTQLLKGLGFVHKNPNLFLKKLMLINQPSSSTTLYLRCSMRLVRCLLLILTIPFICAQ